MGYATLLTLDGASGGTGSNYVIFEILTHFDVASEL
jgi:hypothetical protein